VGPAQSQDGAIRPYCNGVHLSRLLQIPCACKVPGTSKDSYAKTTARMQLQDTQTLILLDCCRCSYLCALIFTRSGGTPVGLDKSCTSVYTCDTSCVGLHIGSLKLLVMLQIVRM